MKRVLPALVVVTAAVALVLGGASVAFAASCSPTSALDIQVDGNACGSAVAVSVAGDADTQCAPAFNSGCIAVSGTQNASNTDAGNCGAFLGASAGCVAISGTGDASNTMGGVDCGYAGVGVFAGCIAVSGGGSASNTTTNAGGTCGAAVAGLGVGCIAIAGGGDASNSVAGNCGTGPLGAGAGCVAVSGLGDASNSVAGSCAMGSVGLGVGCIAVSGAGSAKNDTGDCGTGIVGAGCIPPPSPSSAVVALMLSNLVQGMGAGIGAVALRIRLFVS